MMPLAPGWYRDHSAHLGHRYWDGAQWFHYSRSGSLIPAREVLAAA